MGSCYIYLFHTGKPLLCVPIHKRRFSSVPQIRINWCALGSALPQLLRCECLSSLLRSRPGDPRHRAIQAAATAGLFLPPLSAAVRPRELWKEGLADPHWGLRRPGGGLGWGGGLLLHTRLPGLPVTGARAPPVPVGISHLRSSWLVLGDDEIGWQGSGSGGGWGFLNRGLNLIMDFSLV